jgi:hypothetical protein
MKTGIAIALIVCGTLLVLTPAVHDYLLARNMSYVLEVRTDLAAFSLSEQLSMSMIYRLVCWALGVGMIGVAIARSVLVPQASAPLGRPATA